MKLRWVWVGGIREWGAFRIHWFLYSWFHSHSFAFKITNLFLSRINTVASIHSLFIKCNWQGFLSPSNLYPPARCMNLFCIFLLLLLHVCLARYWLLRWSIFMSVSEFANIHSAICSRLIQVINFLLHPPHLQQLLQIDIESYYYYPGGNLLHRDLSSPRQTTRFELVSFNWE